MEKQKEQQQLLPFKVRDLRKKTQYKIDDVYLNIYARVLGVYATAVYNSLSRHAEFYSQKAFPSERLIAEEHNITERTVRNAIRLLRMADIIDVGKERGRQGKWANNVYFLKDKSEWKKPCELVKEMMDLQDQRKQKAHGKTGGIKSHNQRNIKFKPEEPKVPLRIQVKVDTHIKDNKEENITPKEEMELFINSEDYFTEIVNYLIRKGLTKEYATAELTKFKSCWTEKNGSGKKQRWEMEKTFEIKRRLSTWFSNARKFSQGSNQKGKTIYNTLEK